MEFYNDRPIYSQAEYGSRGTYGKTINILKTSPASVSEKKLKESIDLLRLDDNLSSEDIEICNHENFKNLNMLVLASALHIRRKMKQEKLDIEEVDESTINSYAKNIYESLNTKYTVKTHDVELTKKRITFSIVSYVVLANRTSEEISKKNKNIIKAYENFGINDNFSIFINNQLEIERKIEEESENEFEEDNENINFEFLEEEKEKLEDIEIEIEDHKIFKIMSFKRGNDYLTFKDFIKSLGEKHFILKFIDVLINTYKCFHIEFHPFDLDDYDVLFAEIIVMKSKCYKVDIKKFQNKFKPKKLSVSFKSLKNILVAPVPLKDVNIEEYANLSTFLSKGDKPQIIDFFKLFSKTVKENINILSKVRITSGTSKNSLNWVNFNISSTMKFYTQEKYLNE